MREKILNTQLAKGQIALFYLGQVGFLIKYENTYVMIDGYLSDYVDRHCCSEQVQWVRKYPAPISAEELDFVDFVLCTHTHFDHADPDTLSVLAKVNHKAKYIVSAANVETISAYGIKKSDILGLKADVKADLGAGLAVTALPAAHEELHTDSEGNYLEVGFRLELGDTVLFHAGDGCPYPGLTQRLAGADVCLVGYDRHARILEEPKALAKYGLPESAAALLHTSREQGRDQSAYAAKGLRCAADHLLRHPAEGQLPLIVLLRSGAASDAPHAVPAALAAISNHFRNAESAVVASPTQIPGCINGLLEALSR